MNLKIRKQYSQFTFSISKTTMLQYFLQIYSFCMLCVIVQANYVISQEYVAEEAAHLTDIEAAGNCTDRYCTCAEILLYNGVDCKTDYWSELPILYFKNFSYLPGRMFQRLRIHSICVRDPDTTVTENVLEGILGLRKFLVERSGIQVVPDFRMVKDSIKMIQIESSRLTSLEGKLLQNLNSVWFLSFFNNSIRYIDPDVFLGTYNVRYLDISYNKLTSIPPKLLHPMTALQTFSANHNNLLHVDNLFSLMNPSNFAEDEFTGHESLQYIYLQHNRIKSIGTLQKFKKLLILDIAENDIQLMKPDQLPNNLKIIYLTGNPFKCDCNLKPFLVFLKARQEENILEVDTNVCLRSDIRSSPRKLSNCPSMCSCRCNDVKNYPFMFVDCSARNLLGVPKFLTNKLEQLEDNKTISPALQRHLLIQEDAGSPFILEDSLLGINLENNSLKVLDADDLPPNLVQLYLSNNKLTWLPDSLFDSQLNLKQVSLSGNPWNCSCDALKFKEWLKSDINIILDIDNIRCRVGDKEDPKLNGSILWMIPDLDLCSTTDSLLFIISVCLGILIITIFCLSSTFIYLKYKLNLKMFLYSHGFTSLKDEDIDYDKVFDAFVSFSHEDDEFVVREVISEIEDRNPNIRLCLHYRHFTPGVLINENIIQAVQNSKTTLLILSRNFLDSEWCVVEFRTACMQALKDKSHRIIAVKVGDLPTEMDPTIEAYLKSTTYLTWEETNFWKKLLFVLPSRSTVRNPESGNAGDIDIVFNFSF